MDAKESTEFRTRPDSTSSSYRRFEVASQHQRLLCCWKKMQGSCNSVLKVDTFESSPARIHVYSHNSRMQNELMAMHLRYPKPRWSQHLMHNKPQHQTTQQKSCGRRRELGTRAKIRFRHWLLLLSVPWPVFFFFLLRKDKRKPELQCLQTRRGMRTPQMGFGGYTYVTAREVG